MIKSNLIYLIPTSILMAVGIYLMQEIDVHIIKSGAVLFIAGSMIFVYGLHIVLADLKRHWREFNCPEILLILLLHLFIEIVHYSKLLFKRFKSLTHVFIKKTD